MRDQIDDVGVHCAGPSRRLRALRVQRKGVVSKRVQTNPPDVRKGAAGTAQFGEEYHDGNWLSNI
jgi:hypothetical protein